MSDESIKPPLTSGNTLKPGINYIDNAQIQVIFHGSSLKQNVKFTHKQEVNIYIAYERNLGPFNVGKDFTVDNFFFEAVKLITNLDPYITK